MKFSLMITCLAVAAGAQAQTQPMTLQEAQELLAQPLPAPIQSVLQTTPNNYSFYDKQGESTVNYQGQVMRNVLINDNKIGFDSMKYSELRGKKDVAIDKVNSYYQYEVAKDGGTFILTEISNEEGTVQPSSWEGFEYSSVFPREIDLKSKMAGEDNKLRNGKLLGWNSKQISGVTVDRDGDGVVVPSEFFETLIEVVANNASGDASSFTASNGNLPGEKIDRAAMTAEGLDLAQLSQKFLLSAVSFSQAAGDYLSDDLIPGPDTPITSLKGLYGDNGEPINGRTYTYLQHYWDEAFGYFGAARNYLGYTDEEIGSGVSIDAYSSFEVIDPNTGDILYIAALEQPDFVYSLGSEKNFGLSVYAAKRDLGAMSGTEDFTSQVMQAFLAGRQLLQEKPEGYLPYAQAYAVTALHEWERVFAATVVHYINKTLQDLEKIGTEDYSLTSLAKHFSEAKGLSFAPQFNPRSVMSRQDFEIFHQLIGDKPVTAEFGDAAQYKKQLLQARDLLQRVYSFKTEDVENW